MSDPTIPELPEPTYLWDRPDYPHFTASHMRSMYLAGWRDRGEVDAKACEDRAADVRKANTRGARVSSATLFVVDQLEFAASVIRSIPEPKEGK